MSQKAWFVLEFSKILKKLLETFWQAMAADAQAEYTTQV